jgi:hypothetical protein
VKRERRFALEAFFSQDAPGTLEWLSGQAEAWENHHVEGSEGLGPIADFWSARARATGDLLQSLRESEAGEAGWMDDAMKEREAADARD